MGVIQDAALARLGDVGGPTEVARIAAPLRIQGRMSTQQGHLLCTWGRQCREYTASFSAHGCQLGGATRQVPSP